MIAPAECHAIPPNLMPTPPSTLCMHPRRPQSIRWFSWKRCALSLAVGAICTLLSAWLLPYLAAKQITSSSSPKPLFGTPITAFAEPVARIGSLPVTGNEQSGPGYQSYMVVCIKTGWDRQVPFNDTLPELPSWVAGPSQRFDTMMWAEVAFVGGWPCPAATARYETYRGSAPASGIGPGKDAVNIVKSGWYDWNPGDPSNTVVFATIPLWRGLLTNLAFYTTLSFLVLWILGPGRRLNRARRGLCIRCKYPITGLVTCPECDTPTPPPTESSGLAPDTTSPASAP